MTTVAIVVNVLVLQMLIIFVSDTIKPCLGGNIMDPSKSLITASCRVPLKMSTMKVYAVVSIPL